MNRLPGIQVSLFPPEMFSGRSLLAREDEACTSTVSRALAEYRGLCDVVQHLAFAMLGHQSRVQHRKQEWPRGLKFIPHRALPVVLKEDALPVEKILRSMAAGRAASYLAQAHMLAEQERISLLSALEYGTRVGVAEALARGSVPEAAPASMTDIIPIFDELWLPALKKRDARIAILTRMQIERVQSIDDLGREQVRRMIAGYDAQLVVLETLLPRGLRASHYERYLRLRYDLPEPRFGSYGAAAGIIL